MNAEELAASIRAAEGAVLRIYSGLTREQGETQVHMEEGGWTARQLLAHLTSNKERLEMYLDPQADAESLYGAEYWAWNQRWVDDRDGWDLAALLDLFREQIRQTLDRLAALPSSELERLVPGSGDRPPRPLSEWIEIVCAGHCVRHLAVVPEVLGLKLKTE